MIEIDSTKIIKKQKNFWNHIHFHPTDAIEDDWGKAILERIADDHVAQTVRLYAMLEDVVFENPDGSLRYDFSLTDTRLDYLTSKGFNIFLSYNFMPPFLASDSGQTSVAAKKKTRYKGKTIVTSPPKDYKIWEEICYRFTKHIVDRYGLETVKTWYFQCWNEPDYGAYFMGNLPRDYESLMIRLREYLKLYRGFASGISRVSPDLKIGAPCAGTITFLDGFLSAVKQENLKFDFFSIHTYGTYPNDLNSGIRPFSALNTLEKHLMETNTLEKYFGREKEVIVDEWGASANGFYNIEECPALIFREDSSYAAYYGKMICGYVEKNIYVDKMMICLSGQHEMESDFTGFRNFFTLNGIRKPIYNAFALASKLHEFLLDGQTDHNGLSVFPTKNESGDMSIMLAYASPSFDQSMPEITDAIKINGITGRYRVTQWIIDETHTNPYGVYRKESMPKDLSEKQIMRLREEGILKPVFEETISCDGTAEIPVTFGNNAFVLITCKGE